MKCGYETFHGQQIQSKNIPVDLDKQPRFVLLVQSLDDCVKQEVSLMDEITTYLSTYMELDEIKNKKLLGRFQKKKKKKKRIG